MLILRLRIQDDATGKAAGGSMPGYVTEQRRREKHTSLSDESAGHEVGRLRARQRAGKPKPKGSREKIMDKKISIITLEIGGVDFKFHVTIDHYNMFVNRLTTESKVAPAVNLCRDTLVDREQLSALNELLDRGLALDIAGKLIEESRPQVEIVVKK